MADGNGNGNGARRTFGQRLQSIAETPGVPILGQPCTIEGWFVQLLLMCKCDAGKPVLVIGQPGTAAGQCPGCKQIYQLQTIGIDPLTGKPHFQIGMVVAPAAEPPADNPPPVS